MRDTITTWRELISVALEDVGEKWADVESITLSDAELDRKFDCGYGGPEGTPFTIWTKARVYFPVCYDGAEEVDSVSRNPDGRATQHIGGW